MTIEEMQDEIALLLGCTRHADGYVYRPENDHRFPRLGHPIPATLEEAAKLPEGWRWSRCVIGVAMRWFAVHTGPEMRTVSVPDTGNELYDRFALRLACERAEKGSK